MGAPTSAGARMRVGRARRAATAEALVALCKGETPVPGADAESRADLVAAVRLHRVAPLAHVRLRESAPETAQVLRAERDRALATHVNAVAAVATLGETLSGIPWAVVKGPVLSAFAHPCPGLRTYNDLDVVVAPRSLRTVFGRLLDSGWRLRESAETLLLPGEVTGETNWRSPRGVALDLHWTFLAQRSVRSRYAVHTEAILSRRTNRTILAAEIPTLDPVDAFAHVLLHAGEAGASRMLFLLDVDQLARQPIDWDALLERVASWKAGPVAAVVLRRAAAVLDTPVPLHVEQFVRARTQVLHRLCDAAFPAPRVRREASLPRVVARSTRPTALHTYAALAGKSLHWAKGSLRSTRRSRGRATAPDGAVVSEYLSNVESESRTRSRLR